MSTVRANRDFIRNTSSKSRKVWSDALIAANKRGIGQRIGGMLSKNQHGTKMCCLMVAHEAFGGTDRTRNAVLPEAKSPFTIAMGQFDMRDYQTEFDPDIAIDKYGCAISAAECNDRYNLSFEQIASLVYSSTGHYPTIEVD